MDFPKKQQQCLIPKYLLQYLTSLQTSHNDPTAPWGGGGGGTYTAGTGITISDEDVISIDNTVALKTDIPSLTGYATETWVTNQGYLVQSDLDNYITSTDLSAELLNYAELSDLATVATTGDYNDLSNTPDLSIYELAADAFSGDYNDLTNKPTIPDTTYMVTTNTAQDITGVKTFVGAKMIKFKQAASNNKLGFTGYDNNNVELGYLEMNKSDSDFNNKTSNVLGIWDNSNTAADKYLGFKYYKNRGSDSNKHVVQLVVPPLYNNTNSGLDYVKYIPIDFTDGTTTVRSNSAGIVNISSLFPTIPTKTSDLTNDSGYITASALTGYATESWVTNQGYSTFSGSYNDLTDKPTIPVVPTNVSSFTNDAGYITASALTGYATESWVTNQGYSTFSGSYNDLTDKPTIPVVPTNVSSFTNDAGYITSSALTGYATETWVTNQGYSTFSGSYNDLTDKPTIPDAVSGTNDGTNWTSLTIGNATYGLASSSTPSNMVTTNTTQTITGTKTFQGTYYTTKINDIAGLTVSNGYGTVATISDNISLSSTSSGGFSMNGNVFVVGNYTNEYDIQIISGGATIGQYTFKNKTGDVAVTSEIPTSATSTSTSTVTPSTIQLTFTFEDDTTQTVTLMTGATVSTTTTTTLS